MRTQHLIIVNLIVANCLVFSTLLEMFFSDVDHLWTQDIPNVPLTVGGKTRPHIDQGGSKLEVLNYKNNIQHF